MTGAFLRNLPLMLCVVLALQVGEVHARNVPYAKQERVVRTIDPTGLQVSGKIAVGGLAGGDQNDVYLNNLFGERSQVSKTWMGIGLRYYLHPRLAVATEFDFAFAEHTIVGMDPMGYTMSVYDLLGIELVPLYWIRNTKMFQVFVEGGAVYSRLWWDPDFKNFMELYGVELSDGSSAGFGWYAGSGFRFGVSHFVVDITTRCLYENPGFPGYSSDFDAYNWVFQVSPGFKF